MNAEPTPATPIEEATKPTTPDATVLWRIVDAAANRVAEGLRVVEDYARLGLDDTHLTTLTKQLRHNLATTLSLLPSPQRIAGRETLMDVGTGVKTETELARADLASVVLASWKRVQQGLRSLEEYGKLIDSGFALACEQLRYRSYTLERALDITRDSRARLEHARLYVLIGGGPTEASFAELAQQLITGGAHLLQLRDKQLDDRELLARARLLRRLTRDTATLFIMNDRPDLAVLSQADGVHVGQEELTVKDTRAIVGVNMLIGVSTHSIEQARRAALDGANYIGVGPMFPSTTKAFDAFPGLDFAEAVAREITLPAFAIGGVTLENLPRVQQTGMLRAAVGAAITEASEPAVAVAEFLRRM